MREKMELNILVEITAVSVDKNLPEKERYAEYKRQIKNPLRYKSGKFNITAFHPDNGKSINDCLRGMFA